MVSARRTGFKRLARYLAIRGASVGVSLLIAIFLVVFIANLGGKLDEIVMNEVIANTRTFLYMDKVMNEQLTAQCRMACIEKLTSEKGEFTSEELDKCITECKDAIVLQHAMSVLKAMGLDPETPPFIRILNHYRRAIVLNFGRAMQPALRSFRTRSDWVVDIIAEALPQTILLFTTANIIIFFTQIYLGLLLSRRYGTLADKIAVSLAPLSSMPGWFYGVFLLLLLAVWPRQAFGITIFPDGGMTSQPPPEDPLMLALDILWHMALPIISWMVAYLPIGVYHYRTFFLLFSTEEYVEYARARGIPEQTIVRRYILRPTLPPIITSFVLILISSWMGAIITERVFNWPGLGTVLNQAIGGGINMDPPVIVGIVVIYAYLLAISVIALDIVYAIVDPRVRVGGE
jgi:peptide/nickel transport system permease protein